MSKQIVVGQIYYNKVYNKTEALTLALTSTRKVRVLEVRYQQVICEFVGEEHLGQLSWWRAAFEVFYTPIVNPNKIWKELNDIHDD